MVSHRKRFYANYSCKTQLDFVKIFDISLSFCANLSCYQRDNKLVSVFLPWRRDFILLAVFVFQAARFLLFPLLHFLLLVFDWLLEGEQTRFFSTTEPVTVEHRVRDQ